MKKKKGALTRRDFIRGTVGATLGTSLVGLNWSKAKGASAGSSLVTIVRDKNAMDAGKNVNTDVLKKMLEQTLIKFTGEENVKDAWLSLVKPSDKIGLVPTPHLNPTHDEVTDAVKSSLIESGIPEGNITNAQGGPEKPKACTALIGLPGLKAHWLTGIGTVLKLYILYSGSPRSYHAQDNSKLGEIWNLPFVKNKTRLVLVDALHPLCDKGPQVDPRYKWAYNGLIAAKDPVALETVCLKIIMNKREELKGETWPLSPPPLCVEAADKEYGLGTSKMENIKIETFGWKEGLLL
ncbi:MAG: DUF362 domain-containing protein [Candidatus Aminicenantes bacterium]|nr:MAG: DUF362 domain-containing protein [Candidatus Aminicenantes bacterium]